jgi:phosphoglycerate dehydrogenase-like enzyme
MTKKLVVLLPRNMEQLPRSLDLAGKFADVVFTRISEEAARELKDANGFLLWDFSSTVIRDNPLPEGLSWIHTASLGVDSVLSDAVVSSDIVVSNSRGVFEHPIAEYVLGLLLFVAKDLRRTLEFQRAEEWKWRPTHRLRGQTVALVGPGAIGTEIYRILKAVGVNVIPFGRRDVSNDPVFGKIHSLDALDERLVTCDAVVVSLPLTSETKGVMNAHRFAKMKTGATFINIGRGGLVNEQALLDALKSGQVGTAALDVFVVEPLPKGHPFWSMEQVFVSPHMSADVHGWRDQLAEQFIANLARWAEGRPLNNVVDKQKLAASKR